MDRQYIWPSFNGSVLAGVLCSELRHESNLRRANTNRWSEGEASSQLGRGLLLADPVEVHVQCLGPEFRVEEVVIPIIHACTGQRVQHIDRSNVQNFSRAVV